MINSRFLDGMTIERGEGGGRQAARKGNARQSSGRAAPGELPPARLGHFAPALLGLPDPDHPLRELRRRAGAGKRSAGDVAGRRHLRPARQSARPSSDLEARHLSEMRRARRDAKPTPWTRSSIRPGTSRASPIRGSRRRPPTARRSTNGCRSISISAASSTRFCTCSTRASSPARCANAACVGMDEPFAGLFTQGMVVHETYRARNGEWVAPAKVKIEGIGERGAQSLPRPASRSRSARSRRCRSRRGTRSIPTTSSPPTAPTPRAGSCCRIRRPTAT